MTSLQRRIAVSIPLMLFVMFLLYVGGMAFNALLIAGGLICLIEWWRLVRLQPRPLLWLAIGVVYITAAIYALWFFRAMDTPRPESGLHFTLFVLLVVWATDIGAYFAGKTIGGPKIWVRVSPNKTWAGLIGGMLAACIVGALHSAIVGTVIWPHAILAMLFAVVAQSGDFFESWLKRRAGAKDSGHILPGHGGLLDRVDGLLAVAPIALILWYLRPAMG